VISRTVLVAPESFGKLLNAERVAAAIGRGLTATTGPGAPANDGRLSADLCPVERNDGSLDAVRRQLEAVDFDARMRASRALIVGAERLDEATLLGSATFELATRARQAGVPAYAVTVTNALSLFDARILDLQVILEARDARALRRAGEKLAGLV
jgi:glycerate kinase